MLAGFEIVNVPSRDGMVDPAALEEAMAKYPDQVAGLMMTNPNTLGLLSCICRASWKCCAAKMPCCTTTAPT